MRPRGRADLFTASLQRPRFGNPYGTDSGAEMILEGLAIILSIVSLIITGIGFFASLRFYRDGMELQGRASSALARIEERTDQIQRQVGGAFDPLLKALTGLIPGGPGRSQLLEASVAPAEQQQDDGKQEVEAAVVKGRKDTFRYYGLRGFRLSDVSSGTGQAMFGLGSPYSFNLFDGPDGLIYVGFFPDIDPREAAARAVLLLRRIGQVSAAIANGPKEAQDQLRNIVDSLRIEIIAADGADLDALREPIEETRREMDSAPDIELMHLSDLEPRIEAKLAEIGV